MNERVLNTALVVLTASSVVIVGLVVRRELTPPPRATAAISAPESHKNWRALAAGGIDTGSPGAPVTLTVFSDYQCPYCRAFATSLAAFEKEHRGSVRVVYHHYPLEGIHPFAKDAALAAECANSVGAFAQMNEVLFANQEKIGTAGWGWFADQAGVTDTTALAECVKKATLSSRISSDVNLGKSIPVSGTPTVLINEWRLPGTPSLAELDSVYATEVAHR